MSDAPSRRRAALPGPLDREDVFIRQRDRRIAALASLLVHVLFVMALLYSSKITLSDPEGGSTGGARVKVDFIGETDQDDQRTPVPPTGVKAPNERPRPLKPLVTTPVTSPVDATRVTEAENPVAPDEAQPTPTSPEQALPLPQTRPPASQPAWRRSARWGQPPGMLSRETAPENTGPTVGSGRSQGQGPADAATPSMDVDGHQIYYDLRNELRVQEWQDRGMTEVFFPLPGRREYMVCPLEIVARRGSGGCRLVQPEDPAIATIGDARDVVTVVRVYRRGELVWRGPGAYR
ncbi:type II toxin-antitoxin system RelE/ParE family toxin [Pseudoxanthomonas sp. SL93]|uniref:type II toxin-antitoxin system RelE/ParE family toxin n=1 Tax=Pseudoxanthomonas sp. SL93 TaxID=2995142 RepID=UPI00226D9B4A|nr:type II toxin-antitoxin system RelE/ParE family toxin [Pseudoxanthomonas sp. SL93]WAC64293.1 type II toxin-antitoxin system RelE/ParE family toxin [Pseudoxanthomonas sp. SL93]